MMTCQQMTELVTDYLEGKMSFFQRLQFQMHVGMCKPCRRYLAQMKTTVSTLGELPEDFEIPTEIKQELLASFRDWKQNPSEG